MKILIVGAGIIGLTTAYLLLRSGHHVLLVEREPGPGSVSSFMNGGQFSYSYAEPLASAVMLRQLPTILSGRHAALNIRSVAIPQLLSWGMRFLRNCTAEKFLENLHSVSSLGQLSRKELGRFNRMHSVDFNFRETGKLYLYKEPMQLQQAAALVELKRSTGLKLEVWETQQCLISEPALTQYQGGFAGGVFSPLDQSGDTHKLILGLKKVCQQSNRFELRTEIEVMGFETRVDRISQVKSSQGKLSADAYVLCAGTESSKLFEHIGPRLPIIPVKGYSVTVPVKPQSPEINLTDTQHKIVFTRLGEQLRIAGMMEFAGYDRRIDQDRVDRILQLATAVLPQAGEYSKLLSCWAGLRPMTPDSVPLIGPTQWQNLWLNAGHGMLGSTLAFGSARVLADLLEGKKCAINPTGFYPGRFAQAMTRTKT